MLKKYCLSVVPFRGPATIPSLLIDLEEIIRYVYHVLNMLQPGCWYFYSMISLTAHYNFHIFCGVEKLFKISLLQNISKLIVKASLFLLRALTMLFGRANWICKSGFFEIELEQGARRCGALNRFWSLNVLCNVML